jgi:two-component system, chemotaxis family, sensor kinase CheA
MKAAHRERQPRLSIPTLRNVILMILVVGVAAYTALMFSLAERLTGRFGPQVKADLAWRVQRGAIELSRAAELGLAVGDAAIVSAAFGPYAKSEDVQAIVAVGTGDALVAEHGKSPEPVVHLFAGAPGSLREADGYMVSWSTAEIEGTPIGKVAVVVSTKRLTDALGLLQQSSHTTLGGGLAALVLGALVVSFFTRAVAQRDAQLSDYAHNLERKVEQRTQELDARNRGMRLVLDNVAQGFITVDHHGVLASERSAVVDRWFGAPSPGATLSAWLTPLSPSYASWFEMGLDQLRDDALPAELVLDQLPKRFSAGERTFDVAYTPIEGAQSSAQLLVIVSDVTDALARERAEQEQRELVSLFQRISVDRQGVEEFLTEAAGLVATLRTEQSPTVQQRLVHTLKGNCAIYGFDSYAALAHEIESDLVEHGQGLSDAQRAALVQMWKAAMLRVASLLGGARREVVEIDRVELAAVSQRAAEGASGGELVSAFADWAREPVERRFDRLARQATSLARRLGKPEPHVEIAAGRVRLDPDCWSSFWAATVHAVRNAMDHGIESAEARRAAGKPEAGTLRFEAVRRDGRLTLSLADDGAGIAWEKLAEKAAALDLPCASREDLVEAMFADGVSTRDRASDVSGRGVGMAALRQVVRDMGGKMSVASEPGKSTCFSFTFEEQSVATYARARVAARTGLDSLMPRFA